MSSISSICSGWEKVQQYKIQIELEKRGMSQPGNSFWMPLEKYGEVARDEKVSLLKKLQCTYSFLIGCCRDRMVVGFTITYAIGAYHH